MAAKALGVSLVCGTIGGVISIVVLIAMVLPLGEVVLQFGSPETCALAIFALTLLAGLAEASFLKGLASGFVGLLLTTVGLDTLTGSLRFTFGRTELMTGVDVVAAMVGLFAMTEMFYRIGHPGESPIVPMSVAGQRSRSSRSVGNAVWARSVMTIGLSPGWPIR